MVSLLRWPQGLLSEVGNGEVSSRMKKDWQQWIESQGVVETMRRDLCQVTALFAVIISCNLQKSCAR